MRVLVVAEGSRSESLGRRLRDAGHEVSASGAQGLSLEVLRRQPESLVVELASDDSGSWRRVIERARATSQRRLPALLLLPESSYWLRSPLPVELMPARALPASDADGESLRRALSALVAIDGARAPVRRAGGALQLDRQERLVVGPEGSARLTGSETTLLATLLDGGGGVVTAERIAEGLWGRPEVDRYVRGAIRSHMHTLRQKLRTTGLGEAIVSVPGVGYRLTVPGAGDE